MERPAKRLRFIWNYLDWGGANVYLLAIMKEAAGDWDMEVLLPIGSSQDMLDMITGVGVRYRLIDACLDKEAAPTLARKLRRQWRRIRAEVISYRELKKEGLRDLVVHCELAAWQSWIFYWLTCRQGAKLFFTMHNALPDKPPWRNLIWRARMRYLSKQRGFHILPSNQHTKDSIRYWVEPAFWDAMPVTYTCVNPEEISLASQADIEVTSIRRQHGIPDDAFVVLTVGQFIDRKGRWTVLAAAEKVVSRNDEVYFVWVTPELPSKNDDQRINDHGLGDHFRLIRSRDLGGTRQGILQFYRVANAFTLPSFLEGLPIALLEAIAMGLPAVSTNVFAIPEAVKDGETGLLIEAGDSESLADKILELFHDVNLRERLSKNGREFVLANFDERVAARTAIDHYLNSLDQDQ